MPVAPPTSTATIDDFTAFLDDLPLDAQADFMAGVNEIRKSVEAQEKYTRWQGDPVGFCEYHFGEEYIDDIKKVMESVRDNPTTLARSSNGTGKTHSAARIAFWWYKCFPGSQVYTTAAPPERNLKTLLWGEIRSLVVNHSKLLEGDNPYSGSMTIIDKADPKHFLTGVSIPTTGTEEQKEAKFSGKHAPYLLFIIDEGDAVPQAVYRAIESSRSGGHARLLVMFNPKAEVGPAYDLERDRAAHVVELSALRHPNVLSGEDIIPGAVTRDSVVSRYNRWTRPLAQGEKPDSECVEVPDFLVGSTALKPDGKGLYAPLVAGWRKVEEPAFWYMVLGLYPAQAENQLISRAWIDAARSRYDLWIAKYGLVPPKGVKPVMGFDVADEGKDWSMIALKYGGFIPPLKGIQGVDADRAADWGMAFFNEVEAETANVDGTGVGAGVAPKMSRAGCQSNKVMVASKPTYKSEMGDFFQLRDQLHWSVREWLRTDPGAMLPPDEELIQDLTALKYDTNSGKIKVTDKKTLKKLLKRSPGKGDAVSLLFAPVTEFSLGFA